MIRFKPRFRQAIRDIKNAKHLRRFAMLERSEIMRTVRSSYPDKFPMTSPFVACREESFGNLLVVDDSLYEINDTALKTLELCDGFTTMEDIVLKIRDMYDVSIEEAKESVRVFLKEASVKGLIIWIPPTEFHYMKARGLIPSRSSICSQSGQSAVSS